ncbi:hypothetical protein R6Q59_034089 [Mikania micrantha]
MSFRYTDVFSLLIIVLASTHFLSSNLQHVKHFLEEFKVISSSSSSSSKSCSASLDGRHHHHHQTASKVDMCDDFPRDSVPLDTNTTTTFCVDRNGCWQGYTSTAIVWNDTANSSHGTFYSGSVQVFSTNFVAKNISFMNVAPIPKPGDVGAQAVAIRVGGDQASFWGCGFFGAQDTLHDDRGRHYFKDCYIQGSIDFIFGNAKSLYEDCQLVSMAPPLPAGQKSINGVVTAHGRASADEDSGFAFVRCSIGGTGRIWLGRAWRPFSKVVFAYTSMSDIIAPEGWNDFNDPSRDQFLFQMQQNPTTNKLAYQLEKFTKFQKTKHEEKKKIHDDNLIRAEFKVMEIVHERFTNANRTKILVRVRSLRNLACSRTVHKR